MTNLVRFENKHAKHSVFLEAASSSLEWKNVQIRFPGDFYHASKLVGQTFGQPAQSISTLV